MGTLSGADIAEMRRLGHRVAAKATMLEQLGRASRAGIHSSAGFWAGHDAASFRQTWHSVHAPNIVACVARLREMAATVERNAAAQEATSAAATGALAGIGLRPGRGRPDAGQTVDPSSEGDLGNGFHFGDTGRPDIVHDNGFLQNPDDPDDPNPIATREATDEERAYYESERTKARGADFLSELPFAERFDDRLDLEHGIEAYRHFLEGNGEPRQFDYGTFLADDAAGRVVLDNAVADARAGADDTYRQLLADGQIEPGEPVTFTITSDLYQVGGPNGAYPYPDSEDWQKAIGGHSMWTVTEVTYRPGPDGTLQAEANVTLHAEDRYNFNRNQADIATGEPDSVRGVLEESGLAHQYDQTGSASFETEWTQGEANDPTVAHESAGR
jgi:uncharacterized protein YukE